MAVQHTSTSKHVKYTLPTPSLDHWARQRHAGDGAEVAPAPRNGNCIGSSAVRSSTCRSRVTPAHSHSFTLTSLSRLAHVYLMSISRLFLRFASSHSSGCRYPKRCAPAVDRSDAGTHRASITFIVGYVTAEPRPPPIRASSSSQKFEAVTGVSRVNAVSHNTPPKKTHCGVDQGAHRDNSRRQIRAAK